MIIIRTFLYLIVLIAIIVLVVSISNNGQRGQSSQKSGKIPLRSRLHAIKDPIEAATVLMIAVARIGNLGKVSSSQSTAIIRELETEMGLDIRTAKKMAQRLRNDSRYLNRSESTLPIMTKVLESISTDEADSLTEILKRIAIVENPINTNQNAFIDEFQRSMKIGPYKSGRYYLAQINIARFRQPRDHEVNKDFVDAIESVNAVADQAPGFVWRLEDDNGHAMDFEIFNDPDILVNLSLWENLEALTAFVYRSPEHKAIMRRRKEWFDRMDLHLALWWVPVGQTPTLEDAEHRLNLLAERGPTVEAFTFKSPFSPPE